MTEAILTDRTDAPEPKMHSLKSALSPVPPTNGQHAQHAAPVEELPRLPMQLIEKYADVASRHAVLKQVEDGEWFATVPGFRGVWAKEATEERVLEVLREVIVDWTVLKIQHGHGDLPELDEINLNVLNLNVL